MAPTLLKALTLPETPTIPTALTLPKAITLPKAPTLPEALLEAIFRVFKKSTLYLKVAPRGQGINYGTYFNLMDETMETREPFDQVYLSKKK
jgi:hypothetical protein